MINFQHLLKSLTTRPVGYWLGFTGKITHYIKDERLFQRAASVGDSQICPIADIEFWSCDESRQTVTFGLKDGRRIITKDSSGDLNSLLSNHPRLSRRVGWQVLKQMAQQ